MKYKLFCPTPFEVPNAFRSSTEVFGMGKSRAETLVKRLEGLPEDSKILVFGSAGGIKPGIRVGEAFCISEIDCQSLMKLPGLPTARIHSSTTILKTPKEKAAAYKATGAELIDLEMEYLFRAASESIRKRLYFLRVVIDGPNDDLSFLEGDQFRLKNLHSIHRMICFLKFIRSWRRYLRATEDALQRIHAHD